MAVFVIDGVFAKHEHHPELANIFGGPEGKVIVADTQKISPSGLG